MMTKCPECGSSDIVPDLIVFADEATTGQNPSYVKLVEPEPAKHPFIWMPKEVKAGFRAATGGACGHTQFYIKHHAEILEAHKKGYISTLQWRCFRYPLESRMHCRLASSQLVYSLNIIPPP